MAYQRILITAQRMSPLYYLIRRISEAQDFMIDARLMNVIEIFITILLFTAGALSWSFWKTQIKTRYEQICFLLFTFRRLF